MAISPTPGTSTNSTPNPLLAPQGVAGLPQVGADFTPGFAPGTSSGATKSSGSSTSTGSTNGASRSQSFVPQYDPQLGFLTQFGNVAGDLGAQQYDWAQNEFGNNSDLTSANVNNYLSNSDMAGQAAQRDFANYNDTYNPAMGSLQADAQSYASPDRVASEMGRSEGTVAQNFDSQRKDIESNLRSFGVNPSDPRYAGTMAANRTAQAASEAGAGTQARLATEQTGRDLRSQVLQQANLLPGQSATEQNVAMQGATGAENAALGNTSEGALTLGTTKDYLNTGVANNKFQPLGTTSSSSTTGATNASSQNQSNSQNVAMSGTPSIGGSLSSNGFSEGGAIPDDEGGGYVPPSMSPSGGANTDDIPATIQQSGGKAQINAGEFVVPQDVTKWFGHKFFQDLIMKARKANQQAPAHPQTQNGAQHAVMGGEMQANPAFAQRGVTYQQSGGGPNQGPAAPAQAAPAPAPAAPAVTAAGNAPAPAPAGIPDGSTDNGDGLMMNMSGPTTQQEPTADTAPAPAAPSNARAAGAPFTPQPQGSATPTGGDHATLPTIANMRAGDTSGNQFTPQRTYYSPNRMAMGNPGWKTVVPGDGSSSIGNSGPGTGTSQSAPSQPKQGIPTDDHYGVQPTMKNGVMNYDLTGLNPRPLISGSGIPGDPQSVYGDPPGMGRAISASGMTSVFGKPQPGWVLPS